MKNLKNLRKNKIAFCMLIILFLFNKDVSGQSENCTKISILTYDSLLKKIDSSFFNGDTISVDLYISSVRIYNRLMLIILEGKEKKSLSELERFFLEYFYPAHYRIALKKLNAKQIKGGMYSEKYNLYIGPLNKRESCYCEMFLQ